MNVYLTRDVKIRTIDGLVPCSKLKAGDQVIACNAEGSICVDEVIDIIPISVLAKATEISANNDKALVEAREGVLVGSPILGYSAETNAVEQKQVSGLRDISYNDIAFNVVTKDHGTLIIGDKGGIVVHIG